MEYKKKASNYVLIADLEKETNLCVKDKELKDKHTSLEELEDFFKNNNFNSIKKNLYTKKNIHVILKRFHRIHSHNVIEPLRVTVLHSEMDEYSAKNNKSRTTYCVASYNVGTTKLWFIVKPRMITDNDNKIEKNTSLFSISSENMHHLYKELKKIDNIKHIFYEPKSEWCEKCLVILNCPISDPTISFEEIDYLLSNDSENSKSLKPVEKLKCSWESQYIGVIGIYKEVFKEEEKKDINIQLLRHPPPNRLIEKVSDELEELHTGRQSLWKKSHLTKFCEKLLKFSRKW